MGVFHKMVHAVHELFQIFEIGIGESRGDQGPIHAGDITDPDLGSVQPGSSSFPGVEILIQPEFIDNAGHHLIFFRKGHAYGKRKDPVYEIGGAVQRIDHPVITFPTLAAGPLLGYKPCFGHQQRKSFHQDPFGMFVHFCDKILSPLLFNFQAYALPVPLTDVGSCGFYDIHGTETDLFIGHGAWQWVCHAKKAKISIPAGLPQRMCCPR